MIEMITNNPGSHKTLLCPYPPITSYPLIANMMSAIWSYKENVLPWVCDRFINLVGRKSSNSKYTLLGTFYEYELSNNLPMFVACPFLEQSRIQRTLLNYKNQKLTDFIKYCIENDFFVHVCLDRFYISNSPDFNVRHFYHPTFIYGYDETLGVVKTRDFYDSGYQDYIVSYEDINNAFDKINTASTSRKYYDIISVFKYSPFEYKFNIKKVIRDYKDYLSSEDGLKIFSNDALYWELGFSFGQRYYDVLDHLIKTSSNDLRPFHVLYDHKIIQEFRIKYMLDNGYMKDASLYEEAIKLKEKALLMKSIKIKDTIRKDASNIHKLVEICAELKYEERYFVGKLLSDIFIP